jgi:hypothetical protein
LGIKTGTIFKKNDFENPLVLVLLIISFGKGGGNKEYSKSFMSTSFFGSTAGEFML